MNYPDLVEKKKAEAEAFHIFVQTAVGLIPPHPGIECRERSDYLGLYEVWVGSVVIRFWKNNRFIVLVDGEEIPYFVQNKIKDEITTTLLAWADVLKARREDFANEQAGWVLSRLDASKKLLTDQP